MRIRSHRFHCRDYREPATPRYCRVVVGPATLFSAGLLNVSTPGTLGQAGSATSLSDLMTISVSDVFIVIRHRLMTVCFLGKSTRTPKKC